MLEEILDQIYRIPVPLPDNPLKELNSFLIKGNGRNLLIDTGFCRKECYDALTDGLKQLNVSMEDTDILLTHLHSDHTGNAGRMQKMGFQLMMSDIDNDILRGLIRKYT